MATCFYNFVNHMQLIMSIRQLEEQKDFDIELLIVLLERLYSLATQVVERVSNNALLILTHTRHRPMVK